MHALQREGSRSSKASDKSAAASPTMQPRKSLLRGDMEPRNVSDNYPADKMDELLSKAGKGRLSVGKMGILIYARAVLTSGFRQGSNICRLNCFGAS